MTKAQHIKGGSSDTRAGEVPASAPTYFECPARGFVSTDVEFGAGSTLCPYCGTRGDSRRLFPHLTGPRETTDKPMAEQAMTLLDQAYSLFVLINNRFPADTDAPRCAPVDGL